MTRPLSRALLQQCSRLLDECDLTPVFLCENERNILLLRVAQQVAVNEHRYPAETEAPRRPDTGVPDAYVGNVIKYMLREAARYDALRAKDDAAWKVMLSEISQRVQWHPLVQALAADDSDLIADYSIVCAEALHVKLPRYPFDCPLRAWVSRFVWYEVRALIRAEKVHFRGGVRRLDELAGDQPATAIDGSSDPALANAWLELWFDLPELVTHLSPKEWEVLRRMLLGDAPETIAQDTGVARSTVYSTHANAIKRLRRLVASRNHEAGGRAAAASSLPAQ